MHRGVCTYVYTCTCNVPPRLFKVLLNTPIHTADYTLRATRCRGLQRTFSFLAGLDNGHMVPKPI